jgi:predicted Zn finger-like uncharacterized protein
MPRTRLYVECPSCHMQYMVKDFSLTYSNGAYIENRCRFPGMATVDLSLPASQSL